MTARLRDERGWTLIELLVAMTLMLIVLSATLGTFEGFGRTTNRNLQLNDQQDQVRNTLDQIIRQARNLANPTTGATTATPTTIAYAGDYRFVFQTTDPQKQWVSYCLKFDGSNKPRETIWYETSTNTGLTPQQVSGTAASGNTTMTDACPSTDTTHWQRQVQVADYVTNEANSVSGNAATDRPLFSYYDAADNKLGASTPITDSAVTSTIVRVSAAVFLKINPTKPPAETMLQSAAFMRNQNQKPVASFTAATSGTGYTFDAGASSDPEDRTLHYDWYLAPANTTVPASAASLPDCSGTNPTFPTSGAGSDWQCLATTVVFVSSFTAQRDVFLRVTDPGGLQTMTNLPSAGDCVSATQVSPARAATDCARVGP